MPLAYIELSLPPLTLCVSHSLQVLAWYWPPVLFVIFVGVAVGLYHTYLQPLGAPNITSDDYTQPFTLTSFALALLLVFRTNSSYDRQACHRQQGTRSRGQIAGYLLSF